MLKRTGHWWNRNRIWYHQDTVDPVSAKPHPITIRIAFLSPLLAVVATGISLLSLSTSRTSMEVGQRAYLNVVGGTMELNRLPKSNGEKPVLLTLHATIRNLGNTPGNIKALTVSYKYPKGWREATESNSAISHIPPMIAPKSDALWEYTALFKLDETAYSMFSSQMPLVPPSRAIDGTLSLSYTVSLRSPLETTIALAYSDVFQRVHDVSWCWQEDLWSKYPSACE